MSRRGRWWLHEYWAAAHAAARQAVLDTVDQLRELTQRPRKGFRRDLSSTAGSELALDTGGARAPPAEESGPAEEEGDPGPI